MHAKHILHQLLKHVCPTMHAARCKVLGVTVMAALRGRRLTVTDLGRAIQSRAKAKHCIKRADRLLANHRLYQERLALYGALSHWLLGPTTRPVILVDWSDLDAAKRHFLLRAAVPAGGRALTVYEEVHTVQTKEKAKTHMTFLTRLRHVLPPGCCPILITDAGFRIPWFQQVARLGWAWVGRVRHRHHVQFDQDGPWVDCRSLYAKATQTPKALGQGRLTASNPLGCQLVLYTAPCKGRGKQTQLGHRARSKHREKNAQRQRDPWLLATSLPVEARRAPKIVKLYALRRQIEAAFRDLKSDRFGLALGYSRTRQLDRWQVLLLIAALAHVVLWLVGKATQLSGQHQPYQVNTVKTRVVLSTVFIGWHVIDDRRVLLKKAHIVAATHALRDIVHSHAED